MRSKRKADKTEEFMTEVEMRKPSHEKEYAPW